MTTPVAASEDRGEMVKGGSGEGVGRGALQNSLVPLCEDPPFVPLD